MTAELKFVYIVEPTNDIGLSLALRDCLKSVTKMSEKCSILLPAGFDVFLDVVKGYDPDLVHNYNPTDYSTHGPRRLAELTLVFNDSFVQLEILPQRTWLCEDFVKVVRSNIKDKLTRVSATAYGVPAYMWGRWDEVHSSLRAPKDFIFGSDTGQDVLDMGHLAWGYTYVKNSVGPNSRPVKLYDQSLAGCT